MPLLEKTRVWAKEPEVHHGGEDGADTNADEDQAVVRHRKVTRPDENHGKRLKHCEKGQESYLKDNRFGRMRLTCVNNTICNREVDRRKQQDRFHKEHLERTKDGALENGTGSPTDALTLRVDFRGLLRVGLA